MAPIHRNRPTIRGVDAPRGTPASAVGRIVRSEGEAARSRLSNVTLAAELVGRNHVQLSWIAVAALVGLVTIPFFAAMLQPEVDAALSDPLILITVITAVLITLAVILIERLGWFKPIWLLRVGLLYQLVIAATIAVFENAIPWQSDEYIRGTSTITLWLVSFALLVPAPPLMAAFYCLAGAATGPFVYFLLTRAGYPEVDLNRLAIHYAPCFIIPIVSALVNMRVLRMERLAARARELGSYELFEPLNHGGMGEVWRARHRFLKRDAAVKVIRPDILLLQPGRAADSLRKRFEQEARAIAQLQSPHTVAIHDFGVTEDGGFYYAMELLDGYNLQTLVEQFGPQPPARVVHILTQACASLEEAHRLGMVHRDVKPTNLFLCRLGTSFDFCKLLDFGLVKHVLERDQSQMTATGAIPGTPACLAPEVAAGAPAIDHRVDLYGLGCVAYWLLSGQPVFDEPHSTAMIVAHLQKEPIPPSQRAGIAIPADLDGLVLRLLAKDPDARPASAAELSELLRQCRDLAPWTPGDAERWWHAHAPAPHAVSQPGAHATLHVAASRQ